MSNYSLTLTISQADIGALSNANEQIVLVRRLINAGVPVAWAVLPLLQSNVVTWDDDYHLFATSTPTNVGQILAVNTLASAILQSEYDYSPLGFSVPSPDISLPQGAVQIRNADSNTNAFGFAQGYARSGLAIGPCPINAQAVPARQFVRLLASQSVWIYLASDIQPGMVVNAPVAPSTTRQVFSAALLVDFDSGNTTQSVVYSSDLGQFIPSS